MDCKVTSVQDAKADETFLDATSRHKEKPQREFKNRGKRNKKILRSKKAIEKPGLRNPLEERYSERAAVALSGVCAKNYRETLQSYGHTVTHCPKISTIFDHVSNYG